MEAVNLVERRQLLEPVSLEKSGDLEDFQDGRICPHCEVTARWRELARTNSLRVGNGC